MKIKLWIFALLIGVCLLPRVAWSQVISVYVPPLPTIASVPVLQSALQSLPVVAAPSTYNDRGISYGSDLGGANKFYTSGTYRKRYVMGNQPATGLYLEYSNGFTNAAFNAEGSDTGYITVKCSVEYNSTITPGFFNGASTQQIDIDGTARAFVPVSIPANTAFFVRTYVSCYNRVVLDGAITASSTTFTSSTASFTSADVGRFICITGAGSAGSVEVTTISTITNATTVTVANSAITTVSGASTTIMSGWPTGWIPDPNSAANPSLGGQGESCYPGVDDTGSIVTMNGVYPRAYAPVDIRGNVANRGIPTVGLMGDSILECGHLNTDLGYSWPMRALFPLGVGVVNLGISGDSAVTAYLSSGNYRRLGMLQGCTSTIDDYGTNDIWSHSVTAAQLESYQLSILATLKAIGITKNYICTLLPRTTSTDFWITTTNQQTSPSFESIRVAYNDWLRANAVANGWSGVIDTCVSTEVNSSNILTIDGGYWKVPTAPIYTSTVGGCGGTTSYMTDSLATGAGIVSSNYCFDDFTLQITSGTNAGTGSNSNGTYYVALTLTNIYVSNSGGTPFPTACTSTTGYKLWKSYTPDGVHPSPWAGDPALSGLITSTTGF